MVEIKGGDRYESFFNNLEKKLSKNTSVKVGFLSGATYPDGTSVAMVAAVNEYGKTETNEKGDVVIQPPRPFMRNTVAKRTKAWVKNLATAIKATNYDIPASFKLVGQGMKEDVQNSIRTFRDPPLKEATIKAKGFAKPLIDTSHMLNSVDYEVVDE